MTELNLKTLLISNCLFYLNLNENRVKRKLENLFAIEEFELLALFINFIFFFGFWIQTLFRQS